MSPGNSGGVPTRLPALGWEWERKLWNEGYSLVAGVDEAGVGPLAGPVVAAAVVLPKDFDVAGLGDSKRLTAGQREEQFERLRRDALALEVAVVDADLIDRLNILQAARLAMRRAVATLGKRCEAVLVDGRPVPDMPAPSLAVVRGDAQSPSIAAASIVAKVTRDRLMVEYAERYPGYGFERHKGYPTAAHLEALQKLGPCPIHRRSFGPVARWKEPCPGGATISALLPVPGGLVDEAREK
ncbi:ribonuclease HII [Kyrpidia spormannii]|uniref:Ribonuclease HII n=1 Tax=Kyrpidia spormannii TaxID=2055160 RepID=A0A2K8N6Z1_9BACL|nr:MULTISPECIES: ribonuclease HII [Kyrpidia]ATY85063.1 ribonuclease HII [Kyrpidia spormannii]MCL6574803.1 ribonuclease HII [Kyrpidia sp.]